MNIRPNVLWLIGQHATRYQAVSHIMEVYELYYGEAVMFLDQEGVYFPERLCADKPKRRELDISDKRRQELQELSLTD